jgi:signal transduction histidine kinase
MSSAITDVVTSARPQVIAAQPLSGARHAFTALLPILKGNDVIGVLVLVSNARDPFTALDESFLAALGQQVGAALVNANLYRSLRQRNEELARLSARMVEQHEEERRRLARELHDETAQVFSAVRMELGILKNQATPVVAERLGHVLDLTDTGIQSIRNVTHRLRPSLLDDLGLAPALRSLMTEFGERSGFTIERSLPPVLPPLSRKAELALFRAMQEALSNVLRHAGASRVHISLIEEESSLVLRVSDDGRGLPAGPSVDGRDHMGIAGMRERISALGGTVTIESPPQGGFAVMVTAYFSQTYLTSSFYLLISNPHQL